MLSPKSLATIKQQTEPAKKSDAIYMEVGNGFAYGEVAIGSATSKDVIKELAGQLEWTFREGGTANSNMIYRTGQEFKDGFNAMTVAKVIKEDLESKGYQVVFDTETFR